jgi:hypothetical protein
VAGPPAFPARLEPGCSGSTLRLSGLARARSKPGRSRGETHLSIPDLSSVTGQHVDLDDFSRTVCALGPSKPSSI